MTDTPLRCRRISACGSPRRRIARSKTGRNAVTVLAPREGRVGDYARGVVEHRDEIRLVPAAIVAVEHARTVHDIAHPELVGARRRRSGGGPSSSARRHASPSGPWRLSNRWIVAGASTISGGTRRCCRAVAISIATLKVGCLLLERAERVGDRLRQGADLADVAARPRLERVEAAATIGIQPIAQRLGGDVPARMPGMSYSRSAFSSQPRRGTSGRRAQIATDRRSGRSETRRPSPRGRRPSGADGLGISPSLTAIRRSGGILSRTAPAGQPPSRVGGASGVRAPSGRRGRIRGAGQERQDRGGTWARA